MADIRVSIKEAAERMGLPKQTLRIALQRGRFSEFGEAIATSPDRYTYYINRNRFDKYLEAKDEVSA